MRRVYACNHLLCRGEFAPLRLSFGLGGVGGGIGDLTRPLEALAKAGCSNFALKAGLPGGGSFSKSMAGKEPS